MHLTVIVEVFVILILACEHYMVNKQVDDAPVKLVVLHGDRVIAYVTLKHFIELHQCV